MNSGRQRTDPTPDSILESIRKIMSEEIHQQRAGDSPTDRSLPVHSGAAASDVLELTDELQLDQRISRSDEATLERLPGGSGDWGPGLAGPVNQGQSGSPTLPPELARLAGLADALTGEDTEVNSAALKKAVSESLESLIREWLDANLPDIVERIVGREIRSLIRAAREAERAAPKNDIDA